MENNKGLTKVTFEFPSGDKQEFSVVGIIGAFTMEGDTAFKGANMGAFATGDFTPTSIQATAVGVMQALVRSFSLQGYSESEIKVMLAQSIATAIKATPKAQADLTLAALENADEPIVRALAQLLTIGLSK